MSRLLCIFCAAVLTAHLAFRVGAETAPISHAELGPAGALLEDSGGTVVLTVPLSRSVPWRVFSGDAPPRMLIEFGDLDWGAAPDVASLSIADARVAEVRPGWTQLALLLREPLAVTSAEMAIAEDGSALLEVRMLPTTAEEFRNSVAPDAAAIDWNSEIASGGKTLVAIDPGHGGLDPGAIAGELVEADLMLSAAEHLHETLLATGRFDVVMTRETDTFVSLRSRLTKAREAGAGVFLSLHADALKSVDGSASGITVYRLADDAGPAANAILTERHAADDLLSDVDLTGAGDDVALALLDIARRDTTPRSKTLQTILIESFRGAGMRVNSRPARQGALSVLKFAEMPSVLIELGFLSSEQDRKRLSTDGWQEEAAMAITEALLRWQDEDRLRAEASGN